MATSSTATVSEAPQSPTSTPVQKRILLDVLECIVQLKADFFDNRQPINDDNMVLQRLCAKFEHLIQIGMKEKTSLLGRRKDYWDYFCECLASAKGSNDGIKYVKNLAENKTSLGRGRAFIRFCLVHQRLADSLQQCVAHAKTNDWFTASSVLLSQEDCQKLINSLYDLNALHFDLSPRGYDLDTAWPSFSNRKLGPAGAWSIPISRRSSVTSMDTVSQISVSVDNTENERLARDLEVAQNAKSELIGRIDALQLEKEQVNQSAWATHGELQALQQQLMQLQSQHASLQERYKELDISHMKLKLEKDHSERFMRDENKILTEKFREEESKRVSQLKSEEEIWKKEVREEGDRRRREIDKLQKELDLKIEEAEAEKGRAAEQDLALKIVMAEFNVKSDSQNFKDALTKLTQHMKALQQELSTVTAERVRFQTLLQEEQSEKDNKLSHLESQLLELGQALNESQETHTSLNSKVSLSDVKLKAERDNIDSLKRKESLLESNLMEIANEQKKMQEEIINMKKIIAGLEEKNNDLNKEKNRLGCRLEEVEEQNSLLKHEFESRDADLELTRQDKNEKEQKLSELSLVVENNLLQIKDQETEHQNLKEMLEKKNEEVLVLRKSSEGQATDLEKLLKKKDEDLNKIKSELDDTQKQLELARKEAEEVRSENIRLESELKTSDAEVTSLTSTYDCLDEKVTGLMTERDEMIQEAHIKDTAIKDARIEIENLKKELTSAKENLGSAMFQVDDLRGGHNKSEAEKDGLRTELKLVQAEKEYLKHEMDVEKSRIMTLLLKSEEAKRSDGEEEKRITGLIVENEQLRKEKDEAIAGLEGKIRIFATDIANRNANIVALNSEVENLKLILDAEKLSKSEIMENNDSKIQKLFLEKSESETIFKSIIAKLESEAGEIKQIHENETVSYSKRIKILESQLAEKEMSLEARCLDYENIIERLKKELVDLAKTSSEETVCVSELSTEVTALKEERDHFLRQMSIALEDAQQMKSQLMETSEQLGLSDTQLAAATSEKTSLSSELTSISEELTRVQNEKDAFERELNDMKNFLKVAEDEAQEKLSQKRTIEHEMEDLKDHFNKVVAENLELSLQLEGYQSQTGFSTKVLEENLVEAKDTVEQMKIEIFELQGKCELVEKERNNVREKLEKMTEEKKLLSAEMNSMKQGSDSMDGDSEVSKLKDELREERQKYLSTVESLNEEILALQFQLSAEQMINHDTSQTRESKPETTNELKTRVSDMEVLIEQLERELESLHKTKEMDSTQVKSTTLQVQEMKKLLQTKHDESDKLEKQILEVNVKLTKETARREKIESEHALLRRSYNKDVQERDEEIKNLNSDNEQIKKKLIKLLRDKDTLWHKTDELVTEQKRILGDRWQDNDRVSHCPQCKTEFSLFVRKHHCRVCGKIFCWSCSDLWIDSPYNSKKIRSCQPCFDHNKNLGTASLSTSLVDAESDDSDETAKKSSPNSRIYYADGTVPSTQSLTDDRKIRQRDDPALLSNPVAAAVGDPDSGDEVDEVVDESARRGSSIEDDITFQILDEEAVLKSISSYSDQAPASDMPSNMTSSMLLLADDLKSGEVNRQNEVWIKPGKTFIIPVCIDQQNAVLLWEFSSQPKDIVFSVNYRVREFTSFSEAQEIVAPCKCDSHRQTVRGELMAKQEGIYTLVFDNSYSKVMSKKVHYSLEYKKQL